MTCVRGKTKDRVCFIAWGRDMKNLSETENHELAEAIAAIIEQRREQKEEGKI